jgi:2-methylisocitrate lyase-like PEP mutase family enzyme
MSDAATGGEGKAEQLRRLHLDPAILVLVNVWDVAGARTVASLPGCSAIATGSWPIAAALGRPDGEDLTRDEMLAVVARIADAVDLPVTADLEAGYGHSAHEVGETIRQAASIGIAGFNLEDGERPLPEAVARVAAARKAADAAGERLVLNARLDMSFDAPGAIDQAVQRARAFADAGADCVFPIQLGGPEGLREFCRRVGVPVNAFGRAGGLSVAELEGLGAARVSFGPGPLGAAMAALARVGEQLLDGGAPGADLAFRPPPRLSSP